MNSLHKFRVRYMLDKSDVPSLISYLSKMGIDNVDELKGRHGRYGMSRAVVATIETPFDRAYVERRYGKSLFESPSAPEVYKASLVGRSLYGHIGVGVLCTSLSAMLSVSNGMERMGFENIKLVPEMVSRDIEATYELSEPYSKFNERDGIRKIIDEIGGFGKGVSQINVVYIDK